MIYGIDIHGDFGPNFKFGGRGIDFAILKATGGHTFFNGNLGAQVQGARAAGLEVGFYHYMFEPTVGGGNVHLEVDNFIKTVRPYVQPGTTFWLDVEEYPSKVGYTGNLGDWVVAFCEAVEQEFGCRCGIYCATWYLTATGLDKDARLRKYPFWMASWQDTVPAAGFMAPWDHLTLWQYNADQLDKDAFFGSRQDLRALGVPEQPQPAVPQKVTPFIDQDGHTHLDIDFGGVATEVLGYVVNDAGVRVRNSAGEVYHDTIRGEFLPWVKE